MDRSGVSVTAYDCDILRSAFKKSVIESIPKDRWRAHARLLIRDFTGSDDIDADLLDRIVRR